MLEITSLTNKTIKFYASLKQKKYREMHKLFILDDIDLINEALSQNLITTILFCDNKIEQKEGIEYIKVTKEIIEKLSSVVTPTSTIGICKIAEKTTKGNRVIALDNVQDPGNGGTILRSALAFDFDEMLLSNDCFDIYNEKFVRASKGSFFNMSISKKNLVEELKNRKEEGYEIVIADLVKNAIKVDDFVAPKKLILVVGNEGQGISKEVKEIATKIVYIPISSKIESLNVSVAASIIMQKCK